MDIPFQLSMESTKKNLSQNSPKPTDLKGESGARPPLVSNGSSHSVFTSNTLNVPNTETNDTRNSGGGRKRSNSRSQVVSQSVEYPEKRTQMQYLVTLIPLNETFVTKNLLVPYYPETLKLGRPAGSKIKPEVNNGYFDSRVLSRNHASMFIDTHTGKLMIQDLGSSNGTFVNERKIGVDPVELNIGDVIYLGFNIEVDTSHKKISAKVENINIMPNFLKSKPARGGIANNNINGGNGASTNIDSPEYKHYNLIQSIFAASEKKKSNPDYEPNSFDSALFSDINPELDSFLLGSSSKNGCGIFNNAQVTNSPSLENAINTLSISLAKVRQQNSILKSLDQFAINYQSRLNELNQKYLDKQFQENAKVWQDKLAQEKSITHKVKQDFDHYKNKNEEYVKSLESEVAKLRSKVLYLNQRLKLEGRDREREQERERERDRDRDRDLHQDNHEDQVYEHNFNNESVEDVELNAIESERLENEPVVTPPLSDDEQQLNEFTNEIMDENDRTHPSPSLSLNDDIPFTTDDQSPIVPEQGSNVTDSHPANHTNSSENIMVPTPIIEISPPPLQEESKQVEDTNTKSETESNSQVLSKNTLDENTSELIQKKPQYKNVITHMTTGFVILVAITLLLRGLTNSDTMKYII